MSSRPTGKDELVLRRLVDESDESATVALFMTLYRQSPELRLWLREDFARSQLVQDAFDGLALRSNPPPVARFAELTDGNRPWLEERRRLKRRISGRLFAGLTWKEILGLAHEYQAGGVDLGVYLLVRDWRRSGEASPALMWAGLALLESVLSTGRRRLLRHLNDALALTGKRARKSELRQALGYTAWWKLQAVLYMLQHPAPAYRTRELQGHLASLGLKISRLDIRRFCTRHGIRRDMRAGRPRKLDGAKATPCSE